MTAMTIKRTSKLGNLLRDRRGAGLTEYIILVGVIAMFALAAFKLFGSQVQKVTNGQSATVGNINTAP
jgi:Flp pilus assembly pilin Flp